MVRGGTVVYNTSWTKTLADASTQSFMDLTWTSVSEKAQGYVLDAVNDTLIHIRSIPADIVADSSETLIHSNALVWERAIPGSSPDRGPGRFIVSGLNIFEEGSLGKLRAIPQAEFVFRSLVEYAMLLASSEPHGDHQAGRTLLDGLSPRPPPPLCSRVSSICTASTETPC